MPKMRRYKALLGTAAKKAAGGRAGGAKGGMLGAKNTKAGKRFAQRAATPLNQK